MHHCIILKGTFGSIMVLWEAGRKINVLRLIQSCFNPQQWLFQLLTSSNINNIPWRLFKITYGYHKNDKALTFAAIPRIHVTPITEDILTQIKVTLVLCRWLVTCWVLWGSKHSHIWSKENTPICAFVQSNYSISCSEVQKGTGPYFTHCLNCVT